MSTNFTTPSPGRSTTYVHQVQETLRNNKKAKESIWKATINVTLFSAVLYHLTESCNQSYLIQYLELFFTVVFALNMVYHLFQYWVVTSPLKPLELTAEQKRLMCIKEGDPMFPTASSKTVESKDDSLSNFSMTPLNLSSASWLNSSLLSSGNSTPHGLNYSMSSTSMTAGNVQSPNYSLSSNSWSGSYSLNSPSWPGSPQSPNVSMSSSWVYQPGSPIQTPKLPPSLGNLLENDEPITDQASLNKYLQECEEREKRTASNTTNATGSPSNLSLLWNSSLISTVAPDLIVPNNGTYHLAPLSPMQDHSKSGSPGEAGSTNTVSFSEETWRKEGVSVATLSQWNKNIRQWFTVTVLNRLVKEIDSVNHLLQKLGLNDERVGATGLERLKKTSQMMQVAQNVPSLTAILPFLEFTTHQDYLVNRIRELAQGGCMSDYRWCSGGNYKGKPWENYLPTDSMIVIHLLASYLDQQLPPLLHTTDWRPFSAQHLAKPGDKPKLGSETVVIHQTSVSPPHYVLVWKEQILEVAKGRNNLLHTLLLFLLKLKNEEHGMLGRMNLGSSGLNILWVIDS